MNVIVIISDEVVSEQAVRAIKKTLEKYHCRINVLEENEVVGILAGHVLGNALQVEIQTTTEEEKRHPLDLALEYLYNRYGRLNGSSFSKNVFKGINSNDVDNSNTKSSLQIVIDSYITANRFEKKLLQDNDVNEDVIKTLQVIYSIYE